jgi:hypothetical protein
MTKFLSARRGNNRKGLIDFCEYIKSKYDIKNMSILEIGAYQGESAEIFAKYFKTVHSIDPWTSETCLDHSYNMNEVIAEFDRRTKPFKNVTRTRGFSFDVVEKFKDNSFDVVYIDGDHSGEAVEQDIILYLPKCKKIMAGHDYGSSQNEYKDLIKAVNDIFGKPDKVFCDFTWLKELK